MNIKGQEAGPFELLVAVIMMGFVLIIGLQAMDLVQKNSCRQQTDKMLEDFKTALELVSKSNEQKRMFLDFPDCGQKKDQTLRLEIQQDPALCSKLCTTARPTCVLLRLYNPSFSMIKCVTMPALTNFSTDKGACGSVDNHVLVSLFSEQDIQQGSWQFRNITSAGSAGTPIICAFQECRGTQCS